MSKKVFLGGTCNGSKWREEIKPLIRIDYFDPVCLDWTEETYQRELFERKKCDFVMYVITPKMTGVYSIAEVVDDSNKRPEKTLFCYLNSDDGEVFSDYQLKSLRAVGRMVEKNGGKVFNNLVDMAEFLNTHA